MTSPAQKLRDLITKGEHFVAAEAYSALTGRIVQSVGFQAAYLGGHACSAFHYAVPDNGVFSQIEQLDQATRIQDAMDIPLIADADTLGETVADAFHFTRKYIRSGIAGYHVEDEVNPKHSKFSSGLISIADMQFRIDAATRARGDHPFVIIARCDEMYPDARGGGGTGNIEEAIKRGKAYAEAGADALVFPIASAEAHAQIVPEMPIPVCTLGFNLPDTAFTLSTGWGWTGAAQLHLSRAKELMETGTVKMDHVLPGKDQLIEQDLYDALTLEWAQKTGRKTR
ncbi:isocitrate lyase/PEP mutase family protein [Sphingobium sufflavum]|uniref:isocitrate lyase/PEP mutase family protein n=1 Tax=Sphingobium sufflavum TaxID=1129547 RepID=UPI001F1B10D7|nr:isocitrate lyase/PEP mutase family protein [Sphingobium sufflavum]MCE7795937.1 isocitrate lyase/PEP mutase family protein [Sphingobium sufflavum]